MRVLVGVVVRVAAVAALLFALMPLPAPVAQIPSGGTIQEIRIEGTQRVEPETVRSYLLVQPGDPFDSERLDRTLKSLFATGLFADVTLHRDGDALIVRVVENPLINRIAFEGNHKLTDETLNSEIQLRPRVVYTRQKVQSDAKRILDLYRRNGRFAATVEPKVIPLEQNRVDLVFEIDEGQVTGVRSISFVGNRHFSASRLREIIRTKESRWYRFFSSDDTYDPDRLTYDRDLLRKFYLSQGYADFRVISAVAELTPSGDGFLVTFTVEEGERYRFGKIDLTNQIKEVDPATLRALLTVHEGDWYNADAIEKSISALTDALGNRGFAFVNIDPAINRHADKRTVDVTFNVKEGPRVYVERIDISGNTRTLDRVIRREFRLVEGDAFNTSKMQRSQQRIKNLGFFKKVDVTNVPGSAPDKTVVNVNVEEQSTGQFSVGIGFSTMDGPLVDIGVGEHNFLGKGQDIEVNALVAYLMQQLTISFTEPYFLDRNVAAGWDLFASQMDNQYFAGYNQASAGGTLRAGYQITEALRQTLKYTLRADEIFNVYYLASPYIQDQTGVRVTSSVGHQTIYDRRDNRLEPTSGYFVSLSNDLAGLGGDVRYIRTILSTGTYYSVAPGWVLSVTGEGGNITPIGQSVRLEDRFFVGGDNLRGFQIGGIGPRDINTMDSLGGNNYYVGSVQLGIPLGLPEELGITGHVFSDFGSLFSIDDHGPANAGYRGLADSASLRLTAGIGVAWKSPMGPIAVDLAAPILRQPYDRTQFLWVNMGTRF